MIRANEKLHEVRRGDSHRDQFWHKHHRCPPNRRPGLLTPDGEYDRAKMQNNDDLLEFAIGVYGEGFPTGIPFPVAAMCPACGDQVTELFAWSRTIL